MPEGFATETRPPNQPTAKTKASVKSRGWGGLPLLRYSGHPDHHQPYVLDINKSDVDMGAVLSQIRDGEERAIAYFHNTLTPKKHYVIWKEILAVIKGVKRFRIYIYRQHFMCPSDGCVKKGSPLTKWPGGWR